MHDSEVLTIDGHKVGHVVDEHDGFLILEHGLLKTKHAVPQKCVQVDESEGVLRTTLSKELIHDSPKVNGDFDAVRGQIAEHYGVAEGYEDPPTRGLGDVEPDDPAFTDDRPLRERIQARNEATAGTGRLDETPSSPGFTGGDRRADYPKD
jgi:hypothetical protein